MEEIQNTKFCTVDEDGFPNAFYDVGIHENIPDDALSISDLEYYELLSHQGFRKFEGGEIVVTEPKRLSDETVLQGIRVERDRLLSESDWTQLGDSPLTSAKKTLWKNYRQELRNITSSEDIRNIVWPVKPE